MLRFQSELTDYLELHVTTTKQPVLLGDFNVHIKKTVQRQGSSTPSSTVAIGLTLNKYLKCDFRTSGLHPVDRDEVLKKLPSALVNHDRVVSILNAGLIDILERNCSADDQR